MSEVQMADWQRTRLAPDAIPVAEALPAFDEQVIAWVSDADVSIHHFPVIAWRCRDGSWFAGLPGRYTDLDRHRWAVTHWRRLKP